MSGRVQIFTRNLELTERIETYVNKKAAKLDRFLRGIEETRVDLAYAKSARNAADRQVAQITVRGKGFLLRAEERADDIFAAFDAAMDKIQRRIERFKGKRYRSRGEGRAAEAQTALAEEFAEEEETPIVRRKRFTLTPMNEAEAIEQMQLLGHDNFFIFYNAETNAINVLYRRRDGTYGLIEPELG